MVTIDDGDLATTLNSLPGFDSGIQLLDSQEFARRWSLEQELGRKADKEKVTTESLSAGQALEMDQRST